MPSISPINTPDVPARYSESRSAGVLDNNGVARQVTLGDSNHHFGISRSGSFARGPGLDKDVAARQMVKALRGFISGKSHEKMMQNGSIWKAAPNGAEKIILTIFQKVIFRIYARNWARYRQRKRSF